MFLSHLNITKHGCRFKTVNLRENLCSIKPRNTYSKTFSKVIFILFFLVCTAAIVNLISRLVQYFYINSKAFWCRVIIFILINGPNQHRKFQSAVPFSMWSRSYRNELSGQNILDLLQTLALIVGTIVVHTGV